MSGSCEPFCGRILSANTLLENTSFPAAAVSGRALTLRATGSQRDLKGLKGNAFSPVRAPFNLFQHEAINLSVIRVFSAVMLEF